ncbi:MAG: cupin domain-containing protein [Caulobacteraceae bacterium]|nr:cupin domain-containing protein [Caulobacter sp.]
MSAARAPLAPAAEFARLAAQGAGEATFPLGGVDVRLVRVEGGGEGRWDVHEDGPETVLVVSGDFVVEFEDGVLRLGPGDICVVPSGSRHRGTSPGGAEVVLFRRDG